MSVGHFDPKNQKFAEERECLESVWTKQEWEAARLTILNAHYTNPAYVEGAVSDDPGVVFTLKDGIELMEVELRLSRLTGEPANVARVFESQLRGAETMLEETRLPAVQFVRVLLK